MGCDDPYFGSDECDPMRGEKLLAQRTNSTQAVRLGFDDLSPSGFWATDSGEHVAVCGRCSALVHYPLPPGDVWPQEYVKSTDSLRKHLRCVHGIEEDSDEPAVHDEDPAQW